MIVLTPRFLTYVPIVAALLWSPVAGFADEGVINKLFTFREDQKPLVAPNRVTAPRVVQQPSYPAAEHEAWSNFYTRQDLVPQDYLASSGSKVMRPYTPAPRVPQAGGGWPAIAEQAAENAQAEMEAEAPAGASVMIGDPGDSAVMSQYDAQLGRSTEIGAPKNDWRNPTQGLPLRSRPGDYDYKTPAGARADTGIEVGGPKGATALDRVRAESQAAAQPETLAGAHDDPRYVGFNSKGQVTKYKVQSGDTLGNISSQPAIYNTWKLWPLIYSANRRTIGGNPHNLDVDQRLTIPRNYTEKQAAEAERKSGR